MNPEEREEQRKKIQKAIDEVWGESNSDWLELTISLKVAFALLTTKDALEAPCFVKCAECKFSEYIPGPMDYICRRNGGCFKGNEHCSRGISRDNNGNDLSY